MAKDINITTIEFKLKDFGKLKSVDQAFNKLNKSLGFTEKEINKAIKSITSFDKRNKGVNNTATRSVNTFNKQIAALRELQNNVAIGGKAYRAFGAEADRLRAKLEALTASQKKQGFFGKLGAGFQAGKGAALTGAVGRFLPAGAQIGGAAGFLQGGVPGAIAGGAIGLGVDAVAGSVKFASEAATYASEIQKLQIALKGVTKDQVTFEKGLSIISETSKRLNVPIAASTRQFTTLAASVLGAGGTIEDAKVVFEGVSNSIKATGGNADDVQSAIRAMSQIFGKGKVSAEELQGQLGERLAGAVVKFAEANGSSLQKLQKDLRDGTVGLDQVIKFAQKLNIDFGETAEKVAKSSADAGQRLKVQMDDLKLAVGEAVLPIGAAFQTMFSDIVSGITSNQESLNFLGETFRFIGGAAFGTVAAVRFLIRTLADLVKITYQVSQLDFKGAFETASKGIKDTSANAFKDFDTILNKIDMFSTNRKEVKTPETFTVGGITYDMKTRAAITEPSGLPKLTTDKDIKGEAQAQNKIIELERTIQLKTTEDEIERKLLERKYKFIDAIKEAKNTTSGVVDDERILLETKLFQIDKQEILNKSLETGKEKAFSFKEELKQTVLAATDLSTQVGKIGLNAVNKLADGFAELAVSGKASFGELARSIIQDLQKMIIKALFFKAITSFIPGLGSFLGLNADGNAIEGGEVVPSAKGNVFAKNKVVPYAYGGIIDRPTVFPMKNGAGLMGEAGPEGILPLKRGRDGKLGVIAQGGGVGDIIVNVDATGTTVEGDEQNGRELGRMISMAVQSEIVEQQRPGGLLS